MIKPSSLTACLATIALAVPAGWHLLEADIQTDGPKIRPAMETVQIGDASVTVQVDRGVLPSGGTLSAILVATSDHAESVTVDMTTFEDMGMGGERVPNPPELVDRRKVVLQAQPGGGPPVVASIKLGKRHEALSTSRWYDVYVAAHGKATGGGAAHAGIATWSGNAFAATIEPPASIPVEGPFTVAVRVKNTTKAPFGYLSSIIGGQLMGWNAMDNNFTMSTDDYDVADVDQDSSDDGLAPGAERLFLYRVTPKRPGIRHFTFVTHVRADNLGAMDIASFDRPAPPDDAHPGSLAAR